MSLLDAIMALEKSQDHLQRQVQLVRGKLGLPDGTVKGTRSKYHWVRLFGSNNHIVQAFNNKTAETFNLEVYVAVDPYREEGAAPYVVMGTVATIGTVMDALLDEKSKAEELVSAHATSHEFSDINVGRDALSIHARAIVPLRAQATDPVSMKIHVCPGYFLYQDALLFFQGAESATVTAPVAGVRMDLVYLDCATNAMGVTTGTAVTTIYGVPTVPSLSAGQLPLAYLLLGADTTSIGEENIFDMRPWLIYSPYHAQVTLKAGHDAAISMVGQEIDLADVLTPTEHTAIGNSSPHHALVTLAADADAIFGLSTQQLTLDTQAANTVFAGPTSGAAADPTFRALVATDIPALADHAHQGVGNDGGKIAAIDLNYPGGGVAGQAWTCATPGAPIWETPVFNLIQTQTLGASATSITFSAIPATYVSLLILGVLRTDYASDADLLNVQFNADTGGNYDELLYVMADTVSAVSDRARTSLLLGAVEANNSRANAFSPVRIEIPRYCIGNVIRGAFGQTYCARDANADADLNLRITGGYWNSTAAITAIKVFPNAGTNFVQYSSLSLYGIRG